MNEIKITDINQIDIQAGDLLYLTKNNIKAIAAYLIQNKYTGNFGEDVFKSDYFKVNQIIYIKHNKTFIAGMNDHKGSVKQFFIDESITNPYPFPKEYIQLQNFQIKGLTYVILTEENYVPLSKFLQKQGYRWLADVNVLNQFFVPGIIIEICPGIERLKYSSSIWGLSDNLKRKVKEYVIYDINV